MPDEYGPVQPLVDLVKHGYDKVNEFLKAVPPKKEEAKPDTSWHDAQVKKATESFQRKEGGQKEGTKVPKYHSGGVVKKTGLARLRKGETVLTKTQMKDHKLGSAKKTPKSKRMAMGKKCA